MAEVSQVKQPETPTVGETQPVKKSLCEDAFQNLLQGKRHLLVKDYAHAVQSLAVACELHTSHYGEMAFECGDVYFHYGTALFRLFQEQAGIFGDTEPDGSEEEEENDSAGSEDEKENDGEAGEDKANEENEDESNDAKEDENNDAKEDDSESVTSSKEDEKMDSVESVKPSKDAENSNVNTVSSSSVNDSSILNSTSEKKAEASTNDLAQAGPSTSQARTVNAEEEISDLQLAWETLEIARKIFENKGEDHRDARLKVADILLILGEIGLECDNCEDAIKDLSASLAIWQRYLNSDDRQIAMTHYQLGLAHQLKGDSKKALEYFQNTIDVMQLRIDRLSKQTEIKQNEDGFDIDPKIEISELEGLIENVKVRLEDAKELDKDTKKAIEELALKKVEEVTSTSEEKKPAINISHLLKRKKPDDQENTSKEEVKKIKLSSPVRNNDEQRQSTSEGVSSQLA